MIYRKDFRPKVRKQSSGQRLVGGKAESELCCLADVRTDIAHHEDVKVILKIYKLWLSFM